MSRKANADNTEVKTKLQKVKEDNPLITASEAYGGLEKLPESIKPINRFAETGSFLGSPIVRVEPNFKIKGVGDDEEVRKLPGSDAFGRDPKFYISKKDAPSPDSLGSVLGGIIDTVTFQKTDLDRLGRKMDARPRLIDFIDPKNYELS